MYRAKVHSYTHGTDNEIVIGFAYLNQKDRVLIVDDFLANGCAMRGLIALAEQAGAGVAGCAAAIEKGFQGGGDALRREGIRVESLAIIERMDDHSLTFRAE